jgi:uncharacterized membrane protein YjjP (DUF1212 family)
MQTLRRYRWLALALALWMSATVAAAALAPLFSKADANSNFAVLCTSTGMKLVSIIDGKVNTDPASTTMGHSTLDCPGCLAQLASAPPPALQVPLMLSASFNTPDFLSPAYASREALTASARGPPSLI